MLENQLAKEVVNKSFEIHQSLGPGLFESVYEEILFYELVESGLKVNRQVDIPLIWKGNVIDRSFKADLIVEDTLIVELKSCEEIRNVHFKQLLTYLKITDLKLGLLINFNETLFKNSTTRVVNRL